MVVGSRKLAVGGSRLAAGGWWLVDSDRLPAPPLGMTFRQRFLLATAALAVVGSPALAQSRVRTGLEVLLSDSMHLIRGKRVGLLTNHSGRLPSGTSTIDAIFKAPGVKLT